MSITFDYLIIGGGPAAAREALRFAGTDASVAVVADEYGGCMRMMGDLLLQSYPNELELRASPLRLNTYMNPVRMSPSGYEYAAYVSDIIHSLDLTHIVGMVEYIDKVGERFVCQVATDSHPILLHAKHVILATGLRSRNFPVDIPGANCINCFTAYSLLCSSASATFVGKDVVVFGSGNSAFQLALLASISARSVTILSKRYLGVFPQETDNRFALRAPSQLTIERISKSMSENNHGYAITGKPTTPISFLVYRSLEHQGNACHVVFDEGDNHCHIARQSWRYATAKGIVKPSNEPTLCHGTFLYNSTTFISAIGVMANLPDSPWNLLDDTARFIFHQEGKTSIPNLFVAGTVGGCRSVNTMDYAGLKPFLNDALVA